MSENQQLPKRIEMVDDAMAEVLRSKSPTERIAIAHGMWNHASRMISQVLRKEHQIGPIPRLRKRSHGGSPMEQSDLLAYLCEQLNQLGIRYFITVPTPRSPMESHGSPMTLMSLSI